MTLYFKSTYCLLGILFSTFFLIISSVYYYFNRYDEKFKSRILQLEKYTTVLNIYQDSSQHNFTMLTRRAKYDLIL